MAIVRQFFTTGSKWYNQLGSVLVITANDGLGRFEGSYCSKVGEAKKQYTALGSYVTDGSTLAWSVAWKNQYLNANSCTAWSGQMQHDSAGNPVILTTWLLTQRTEPQDDWAATNVGVDTFKPLPYSEEEVIHHATISRACQRSHPKAA